LPPRVSRPAYFAALDYLEAALWYERPVKSATWKRWVDESPEGGLGLVAPKALCTMQPGPELEAARAQLGGALGEATSVVLFPTPPAFSPSANNRDLLRRFFAEVVPAEQLGGATRVWRPSGLWDLATAAKTATEAGVVLSWDPLGDPTTPAEAYEALEVERAYWRPEGLGRSGPLSPDLLDRLAALGEVHPEVWIVLATPDAWKDAKRVRDLVQK
jgi:hypothetical protein